MYAPAQSKAAEDRRTPKPDGIRRAIESREASWSAVPLHRFRKRSIALGALDYPRAFFDPQCGRGLPHPKSLAEFGRASGIGGVSRSTPRLR